MKRQREHRSAAAEDAVVVPTWTRAVIYRVGDVWEAAVRPSRKWEITSQGSSPEEAVRGLELPRPLESATIWVDGYESVVHAGEDGGWWAEVPSMRPHLVATQGDDMMELAANLSEVIALMLEPDPEDVLPDREGLADLQGLFDPDDAPLPAGGEGR